MEIFWRNKIGKVVFLGGENVALKSEQRDVALVAANHGGLAHPGNRPGKNKDGLLAQIMWTLAVANLDNSLYFLDCKCGTKFHGMLAHC